jgi:ATP-dependent Clp protease ATP-binding subunit ClpX
LHYLFYVIEMVDFNTRSGADSGISGILDDDENVELEKSNVLLMGPTGSGITFITTSL